MVISHNFPQKNLRLEEMIMLTFMTSFKITHPK